MLSSNDSSKNGSKVIVILFTIIARIVGLVLIILILWAIWASVSTSGLYELRQINPDYPHPDKNIAFLVTKVNGSVLDALNVEKCSPYMPNWVKARECVEARLFCQSISPKDKYDLPDFSSDEYQNCFINRRPFVGFDEILHASRPLFRILVAYGILRLTKEESLSDSESKKWWKKPLSDWLKQGDGI